MTKNVLVTGGAGFLGSAIVRRLVRELDTRVFVYDDFSTGCMQNLPAGSRRLEVSNDVRDFRSWSGMFDEVYHFASPASPEDFRNWQHIISANVDLLAMLPDTMRPGGSLFVASSSEAYGVQRTPMEEGAPGRVYTGSVRSVYDECKRLMEAMAWQIKHDETGRTVVTLRIFNTYGPGMPDDGRAINTFVRRAKNRESIPVHGDGSQTRSFCYVTDFIDMLFRLRATGVSGVYNIGCDDEVSIMEVARIVQGFSRVSIEQMPARPGDPTWRRPDLTRLERLIGPTDYTSLQEGVRRCFD